MAQLFYFSPTGGTKVVGTRFCAGISSETRSVNLATWSDQDHKTVDDVVVAVLPVFGGRIPALAADRLKKLEGTGKKAVTIVVYGNRAYEDALVELNDTMEQAGFQIIASGAFIAQHSMVPEVAQGRPDAQDLEDIDCFAKKVAALLEQRVYYKINVPGNRPYKQSMRMPATPISLPDCRLCGACAAACPTKAIAVQDVRVSTNGEQCMLCMACTSACPEHLRILPPPLVEKLNQMLAAAKTVRRENEVYL